MGLPVGPRSADVQCGPDEISNNALRAFDALAQVHTVPWEVTLAGWETIRSINDELGHWEPFLRRCNDQGWLAAGTTLLEALRSNQPHPRIGLLHGDFQTNNLRYRHDGSLAAIIWELAGIGPQLLDLGWMALFLDLECWAEPIAG